jgi:excisionase family DNA binding protein
MDEKIWRVREVAARLGVTGETVLKQLHEGTLKGFRVGRAWRITDAALAEFMQPSNEPPPDAFSDLNTAIAPGGECTRPSDMDQAHRDNAGRPFISPVNPDEAIPDEDDLLED